MARQLNTAAIYFNFYIMKKKYGSIRITTDFLIMKALQLSYLEYGVMEEIRQMSGRDHRYPYCLKSYTDMAEMFCISRDTYSNILNKLLNLEYIECNDKGKYRTVQYINNIFVNPDAFYIAYKDKEFNFISGKPVNQSENQTTLTSPKIRLKQSENQTDRQSENRTLDIHIKEIHRNTTNSNELETIPNIPEVITSTLKDRGVEFEITAAAWKGFREEYPLDKLEDTVVTAIHWIADKYAEKHKTVKDKVLRTGRLRVFLKDVPKIPKRFPYEPYVAYKIRCNPNATEYEKQIYEEMVKQEKERLNIKSS